MSTNEAGFDGRLSSQLLQALLRLCDRSSSVVPLQTNLESSSFLIMACRLIITFIIAATLLQFSSVSAADRHADSPTSGAIPGSQTDYYLRGQMVRRNELTHMKKDSNFVEESPQERRLWEPEMSSDADSVHVEDYSPPCANSKHDPSVCKHN